MFKMLRAAFGVAALVGCVAAAGGMLSAPASAQSACGSTVTVGPGDTLGRIAARCGTSMSALLQANPQITNPNNVFVGQVIRMPGAAAGAPSGPSFTPPSQPSFGPLPHFQPPSAAEDSYVVRPGDTLAAIADRLGIPLAQLISANPNVDPRFVRPGTVLRVPAGVFPRQPGPPRDFGPPRQEAALFVEPGFARPGGDVELTALGLPPGSRVRILGGSNPDDLTVIDRTETDRRGRLRTSVEVPDWARPGRPFYFAVETRWPPTQVLSEPIRIAWGGRGPGRSRDVTVIGTITREGVECPALRGDDGRLYTLAGDFRGYRPGDRVRIEGRPAEFSTCMQGTTIEVSRIRRAD